MTAWDYFKKYDWKYVKFLTNTYESRSVPYPDKIDVWFARNAIQIPISCIALRLKQDFW